MSQNIEIITWYKSILKMLLNMWYWVDTWFAGDMENSDVQPFNDLTSAISWWLTQVTSTQGGWLQNVEDEIRKRDLVAAQVSPKLMTKNRLIKTVFRVTFYESDEVTIPDTDSQNSYASITDSDEVRTVPDAIVQELIEALPAGVQSVQKLCEHSDMIARLSKASIDFWSDNQFVFRKMRWYMQRNEQIPFEIPQPRLLDDICIEALDEPFVLKTYTGKCIYPDRDDYGSISTV